MKVPAIVAVMVLGAASMWAQAAAPATPAPAAQAATAAPDAAKPADHAACTHDKDMKMSGKKGCCKKCARHKKTSETKS